MKWNDMKAARRDSHIFKYAKPRDPVAIVSGAFCCLFATDAVDTHPEDKGRISDSESGHDEHLRIQRQPFCRAGGRANRRQCQ